MITNRKMSHEAPAIPIRREYITENGPAALGLAVNLIENVYAKLDVICKRVQPS